MSRMRWGWVIGLLWAAVAVSADELSDAEAMLAAGKTAQAAEMLASWTKAHPEDARAWFLLGVAEARRRHYQEAIAAFRAVVRLAPHLAAPHNNLAVLYNELGDPHAAADELERAVELEPEDPVAWENLARVYLKLTLRAYRHAIALAPSAQALAQWKALQALQQQAPRLQPRIAAAPSTKPKQEAQPSPESEQSVSKPEDAQAQARKQVLDAVERWRAAWQARDLDGYFAAYSDRFRPPKRFASLDQWRRYKRRVILGKRFIRVRLEKIEVALEGNRARVRFVQHYASDTYRNTTRKELLLEKEGDAWKIVEERAL